MALTVLKVPYGRSYWAYSIGAYNDKITNRWYIDSSIPLPKQVQAWVVDEQPREKYADRRLLETTQL